MKYRFDLFHAIYNIPTYSAGIFLKWATGKPVILTHQEKEPLEEHFKNPIKRKLIIWFLSQADYMTTVSWQLEKYLKENYFQNYDNLVAIPNWVEDKFRVGDTKLKEGR